MASHEFFTHSPPPSMSGPEYCRPPSAKPPPPVMIVPDGQYTGSPGLAPTMMPVMPLLLAKLDAALLSMNEPDDRPSSLSADRFVTVLDELTARGARPAPARRYSGVPF